MVGECDGAAYPIQKKKTSLEFLRSIAHLRARTNTLAAVARVRSTLAQATHEFFQGEGFRYVQTPLITASDCEAAGGTGPLPRSSRPPHRPAWWSPVLWLIIVGQGFLLWLLYVWLLQFPPFRKGYQRLGPWFDSAFGAGLLALAVFLVVNRSLI